MTAKPGGMLQQHTQTRIALLWGFALGNSTASPLSSFFSEFGVSRLRSWQERRRETPRPVYNPDPRSVEVASSAGQRRLKTPAPARLALALLSFAPFSHAPCPPPHYERCRSDPNAFPLCSRSRSCSSDESAAKVKADPNRAREGDKHKKHSRSPLPQPSQPRPSPDRARVHTHAGPCMLLLLLV